MLSDNASKLKLRKLYEGSAQKHTYLLSDRSNKYQNVFQQNWTNYAEETICQNVFVLCYKFVKKSSHSQVQFMARHPGLIFSCLGTMQ